MATLGFPEAPRLGCSSQKQESKFKKGEEQNPQSPQRRRPCPKKDRGSDLSSSFPRSLRKSAERKISSFFAMEFLYADPDAISAKLKCSITQEPPTKPVVHSGCKNIFDRSALDQWLARSSTCPMCKAEVTVDSFQPNDVLEGLLDELTVLCPKKCPWRGERGSLADHLARFCPKVREEEAARVAAEEARQKRTRDFEKRRHAINPVAADVVVLNVGGTQFHTSRATLVSQPDSMLAHLFSEDRAHCGSDGVPFLDLDPTAFGYILQWLRDGSTPTLTGYEADVLLRQAKLLGLNKLLGTPAKKSTLVRVTQEQVLSYVNVGHTLSLPGCDLSGLYLGGMNLENANFMGSCLRGVNLGRSKLSGANFTDADLSGADLRDAVFAPIYNLDQKDKSRAAAILIRCNLNGANLQSANLQSANLRIADLESADLLRANLESANLQNANLESANLQSANLEGANLQSANLQKARLGGANLKKARLVACILFDVRLTGLALGETDLAGSKLNDECFRFEEYDYNTRSSKIHYMPLKCQGRAILDLSAVSEQVRRVHQTETSELESQLQQPSQKLSSLGQKLCSSFRAE